MARCGTAADGRQAVSANIFNRRFSSFAFIFGQGCSCLVSTLQRARTIRHPQGWTPNNGSSSFAFIFVHRRSSQRLPSRSFWAKAGEEAPYPSLFEPRYLGCYPPRTAVTEPPPFSILNSHRADLEIGAPISSFAFISIFASSLSCPP
jgi:hypothetical protein